MPKIFISAGELSGDMHGGLLVSEIKRRRPDITISAIGGDNMANAGAKLLFHIRETSFMGFTEVVKHLPFILKLFNKTVRHLRETQPDLVVLVDYPGFNLKLAKAAAKLGIPVVYYISPTVWAWHQSRVKIIRKYTKQILCILPFEEDWYRTHNVSAKFVGHPLLDRMKIPAEPIIDKTEPYRSADPIRINLFPGSRKQEVERLLPDMIDAVRQLHQIYPNLSASISVAPQIHSQPFRERYPDGWLKWISGKNEELMRNADVLIITSGTATLEATFYGTPMIVVYKMSPLNYRLGKLLVHVWSITIANLVAGKRIVPELVQEFATAEQITAEVKKLLDNPDILNEMRRSLREVSERMGKPGASARVAEAVLSFLPEKT
ncbi:MAG: lipid-A-disaccharide synthase [Candidatus Neomarinimicrobiota bacterium]